MPETDSNTQRKGFLLLGLTLVFTTLIFGVDVFLPAGYSICLAYIMASIVFIWKPLRKYIFLYAILASVLTIAGHFISPDGGNLEAGLFNRAFTLTGIWSVAYILRYYSGVEKTKDKDSGQLDALYEAATEAIIVTAEDGKIIMANPRSHALFGYAPGSLTGLKIEELIPARYRNTHEKQRQHFYGDPHARAMGMGRDLFARRKDGSEFPVEVSLSFYRQNGQLFVISFVIDITKRKESENALLHAKADLEKYASALQQSNEELEQFAYVASHDLQEPLRKIQAFGDRLLGKENENLSESGKDYLSRILNAAGRMKGLINDLLSFSRVTTQAKPFSKVDLNQLAAEVMSDIEVAIERAHAQVEIKPLPTIEADALQMRQLFQNLLSNAIKFRKEDVAPVIRVYGQEGEEGYIRLYFEDNGIGFDERYVDKIFTIFQRLEGRNYEGTGVGLAICKKIAVRHGGDIMARSRPGEGSTFIVTLPLTQSIKQQIHIEKLN